MASRSSAGSPSTTRPRRLNLLTTELGSATFRYFVKGHGSGSVTDNGANYSTFDDSKTINSGLGLTEVTRSVVNVASANFAGGDPITTGQVTQFVIVPEPGALTLAGIAAAAWAARAPRSCFTDGIWDMLMVPADPPSNVLSNTGEVGKEK